MYNKLNLRTIIVIIYPITISILNTYIFTENKNKKLCQITLCNLINN